MAKQVVDVHTVGGQERVLLAVANGQSQVLVRRRVDDERFFLCLQRGERFDQAPGLDLAELEAIDDDQPALFVELGQRGAERTLAYLARRPVAPVARARR